MKDKLKENLIITLIKSDVFFLKKLEKYELPDKKHNSQMDVVLALWDAGLIEK